MEQPSATPRPSVQNIGSQALVVADAFAREGIYKGPSVVQRDDGTQVAFVVAKREFRLPKGTSYSSFLLHYLKTELGVEWYRAQTATRRGRQHPLIHVFRHAFDFSKLAFSNAKALGASHYINCGAQRELMTLASDLVTLDLVEAIPTDLFKRLRKPDQYQGARYEVAVGAGLVRAGFLIEWLPSSVSNVEFIASHPKTGDRIAVEAKSRHRENQYKSHTASDTVAGIEADVSGLYHKACKKQTLGHPLAIFIDANIPYRHYPDGDRPLLGLEGLADSLKRTRLPTAIDPVPEFVLIVTTCGWYYSLARPAYPVRNFTGWPQWTCGVPGNFNTYVALFQAIKGLYTVPGAGDLVFPANDEMKQRLASD